MALNEIPSSLESLDNRFGSSMKYHLSGFSDNHWVSIFINLELLEKVSVSQDRVNRNKDK